MGLILFLFSKVALFFKLKPTTVPKNISPSELIEDYFCKYHYKIFPVVPHEKLLGGISTSEIKQFPPHSQDWKDLKFQDYSTPYNITCKDLLKFFSLKLDLKG